MGQLLNVLPVTDSDLGTKEADKCCSPHTSGNTSANLQRV